MMKVEAKKNICPFMSNRFDINAGTENSENGNIQRCITDSCMAWHWHVESADANNICYSKTDGYCRLIHEGES